MDGPILIIALPTDLHAFSVAEVLRQKGSGSLIWCTSDYPSLSGETIRFSAGQRSVRVNTHGLLIEDTLFSSIWHRRLQSAPDRSVLHPADRAFATQQCEAFRRRVFEAVSPDSFWVNSPASSHLASQKILQQHEALGCGLVMPDTIISNDPDQIRGFIAEMGGTVATKTLAPASWEDDEDRTWIPYTACVRETDLVADPILRQVPMIFQAVVAKAYEVRMTVMGKTAFPVKINSQDTVKGRLDWRLAYSELKMEQTDVPSEVMDNCFALMNRLGIVFGCFDFIVTPDGEWIFLEVNEMGQFLFIESYTGMPLLDAFADFLISGQADFRWAPRGPSIRFSEVLGIAGKAMADRAGRHAPVRSPSFYEGNRGRG